MWYYLQSPVTSSLSNSTILPICELYYSETREGDLTLFSEIILIILKIKTTDYMVSLSRLTFNSDISCKQN